MAKSGKKNETKLMTNARAAANQQRTKKNSAKKNQNNKSGKKPGAFSGIREYLKGVRLEMKKVVWPTKKELTSFTVVVLATCVAFALLFWGIDSGVLAAIKAICF